MTTIDTTEGRLTLINTFHVKPEQADALLGLLIEATRSCLRDRPGFVSANFHVNGGRTRIANYAQWRSRADFEAMLTHPEVQAHMARAAALADSFEPVTYEVVHVEPPGDGGA